MEENPKRQSWKWWGIGALVLAFYTLSLGPVTWLLHHGFIPRAAVAPYLPVIWFSDVAPRPLQKAMRSYFKLWMKKAPE